LKLVNNLERGSLNIEAKIQGLVNIYKIRLRNSSNNLGKSSGFRVIFRHDEENETFILLAIYCKSLKSNISKREIENILKEENL
jgi:hypothetical protein